MSSFKEKVRRLEAAGYSEDTIAMHTEQPHYKIRQALKDPSPVLSTAARDEIFYDTAYEHSQKGLARMYRISDQEVYKAKFTPPPKGVTPSRKKLELLWAELHCPRKVAQKSGATLAYVKRELADLIRRRSYKADYQGRVEPLLDSNLSYQQIADQVGCSQATVCNIAKDLGKTRQQHQSIHNWPDIMAYAETHTVSETSRKFGVTRANIYYHKKKVTS